MQTCQKEILWYSRAQKAHHDVGRVADQLKEGDSSITNRDRGGNASVPN